VHHNRPAPSGVFQDWQANTGNAKSQLVLAFFRVAQRCHSWEGLARIPGLVVLAVYTVAVEWLLGIELSYKASVGPGLRLYHGIGLVVHENARIGARCILRNGTTIGMRKDPEVAPTLEDDVEVGSQAIILGGIRVGSGARVAAGAVVLKNVPPGATAVGNPARVLRRPA